MVLSYSTGTTFFCFPVTSVLVPVVLYGCETWSLTLREEHSLRVFENRVLRGIFGPKCEEVAGGWKTLQNEYIHNFFPSPNIISEFRGFFLCR